MEAAEGPNVVEFYLKELSICAVEAILLNPARQALDAATKERVVAMALACFTRVPLHALGADMHLDDSTRALAISCLSIMMSENPALRSTYVAHTDFMKTLHVMAHPDYVCIPAVFKPAYTGFLRDLVTEAEVKAGVKETVDLVISALHPINLCLLADADGEGVSARRRCAICYGDADFGVVFTPCIHVYHAKCLRESFCAVGGFCPECMTPVMRFVLSPPS